MGVIAPMSGQDGLSLAAAQRTESALQWVVLVAVIGLYLSLHLAQDDPWVFYHLPHDTSSVQGQTFISHISLSNGAWHTAGAQ